MYIYMYLRRVQKCHLDTVIIILQSVINITQWMDLFSYKTYLHRFWHFQKSICKHMFHLKNKLLKLIGWTDSYFVKKWIKIFTSAFFVKFFKSNQLGFFFSLADLSFFLFPTSCEINSTTDTWNTHCRYSTSDIRRSVVLSFWCLVFYYRKIWRKKIMCYLIHMNWFCVCQW